MEEGLEAWILHGEQGEAYQLIARLGAGGSAEVYEARVLGVGVVGPRERVVKVPREATEEAGRRLAREFEVGQLAQHPRLCRALDRGVCPDGRPFVVFERVWGEPLGAALGRVGRFGVVEAVRMVWGLLDALASMPGVVHKDLKPDNLMLRLEEGGALGLVVLDFGSAAWLEEGGAKTKPGPEGRLTHASFIVGTAEYLPPELLTQGGDFGGSADVYQAGLVLAELVSGECVAHSALGVAEPRWKGQTSAKDEVRWALWKLQTAGLLALQAKGGVPALDEALRGPLGEVIRRSLALEPAARYPSAAQMRDALGAALEGLGAQDEGGLLALERRARAFPHDDAALTAWMGACEAQGEWLGAMEALEGASPRSAAWSLALARIYERELGDPGRARRMLEDLRQHKTLSDEGFRRLEALASQQGDAAARVELWCERPDAFETTPEGVKARLRRAAQEAHALARDPLEEAAWGKVLALDPASTEARVALARVHGRLEANEGSWEAKARRCEAGLALLDEVPDSPEAREVAGLLTRKLRAAQRAMLGGKGAASRDGLATTREGVSTTREGLATTREGVSTTREGLSTTRGTLSPHTLGAALLGPTTLASRWASLLRSPGPPHFLGRLAALGGGRALAVVGLGFVGCVLAVVLGWAALWEDPDEPEELFPGERRLTQRLSRELLDALPPEPVEDVSENDAPPDVAVDVPAPVECAKGEHEEQGKCEPNQRDGMVYLEAGRWRRGKEKQELGLGAFWLDAREVSAREYAACVAEPRGGLRCTPPDVEACSGGTLGATWAGAGPRAGHEDAPINCISWAQAEAYCRWAGKRLPREEEWERAARGPAGRRYPWGEEAPRAPKEGEEAPKLARGNFADEAWRRSCGASCAAIEGYEDGHVYAAPVGSFALGRSAEGLDDLAGNVWEWVRDDYLAEPSGKSAATRVVRGGSFQSAPEMLQGFERDYHAPSYTSVDLGVRCAKTP